MAAEEQFEQPSVSGKPPPKPRHIIASTILVLVIVFPSILWGALGLRKHYQGTFRQKDFSGRKIDLHSYLITVDANVGVVLLNWRVDDDTGCDDKAPDPVGCSPVEIFFDGNLSKDNIDNSDAVASNFTKPIFTWDPNPATRKYARKDSFRTSIQADPAIALQFYPWDESRTSIYLSAQVAGTTTPVGIEVGVSSGQAIGYYVTTNSDLSPTLGIPSGVIYEEMVIRRGAHVKAYSIVIVITVWLISLVFIFATSMHLAFGYAMGSDFLVIPIGTLFTVTSLRSTMPGAPDFGTVLDYVALLPCLAVLSFCATLTLATLAFADHDRPRKPLLHGFFRRWREGARIFPRRTTEAKTEAKDEVAAV